VARLANDGTGRGVAGTAAWLHGGVRYIGAAVMALNVAVAALSLGDMYLLASGAVRVGLPGPDDFHWSYDSANMSIVFAGNYSVVNSGFYDITGIVIDSSVSTASGVELVRYKASEPDVRAFGGGRYPITARMPVARLLYLDYGSMLFNATHFHVHVKVDALYTLGLARFHADQRLDIKWEPPLARYAPDIVGGNLSVIVRQNITAPAGNGSLEEWISAAIMGNGTAVTIRGNTTDFDILFDHGVLRLTVMDHAEPPAIVEQYAIPIPLSGGN